MIYLTEPQEITNAIAFLAQQKTLWIDTETANWRTRGASCLSLIQVLANPNDLSGDEAYILDVLKNPESANLFINEIMMNGDIEKVFHNAPFDLKLLGGKENRTNVTCTLKMAREIPAHLMPHLSDKTLKTLAMTLGNFSEINKEEGTSDWSKRPLTPKQLQYAKMDTVYLAVVHTALLKIINANRLDSAEYALEEDVESLAKRYKEVKVKWVAINSEKETLEEKLKEAMYAQNIEVVAGCKLSTFNKRTIKATFKTLMDFIEKSQRDIDFTIILTNDIQEQIGKDIDQIPIEEKVILVKTLRA